MADSRREQIINAIVTTITGLPTLGSNVGKGRVYDVTSLPWAQVIQGSDQPVEKYYHKGSQVDRILDITIKLHIQQTTTLESTLNSIEKEIYNAIFADRTLGLNQVFVNPSTTESPQLEQGEQPVGEMSLNYTVKYLHDTENIDLYGGL